MNHNTQNQRVFDLSEFHNDNLIILDLESFLYILAAAKVAIKMTNTLNSMPNLKAREIVVLTPLEIMSKETQNTNIIKYVPEQK